MSLTCDVVVVGAGVIGCSTALELARTGTAVVVVDKAGVRAAARAQHGQLGHGDGLIGRFG